MLENKEISSVQLLHLYMKRALTIGRELHGITVENYNEALQIAKNCDQMRETQPENCKGELFGIVISVKDCLIQKGHISTLGCASRLSRIPEENDGLILNLVKQSGAIPFIRTNVPQLLLNYETHNNIFGTAQNPWKRDRVSGGSSGGESTIVASRCSPIGIGTDIGGSVRIPSAFCGLVGFKPGQHRLSSKGNTARSVQYLGDSPIKTCIGPMVKYVDDAVCYMQTVLNSEYYNNIPLSQKDLRPVIPWDQQKFDDNKKKRIGYFKTSQFSQTASCVQRGIDIAVDALKKQGHQLVEIEFLDIEKIRDIYVQIVFSDGFQELRETAKGEDLLPMYKKIEFMYQIPRFIKKIFSGIAKLLGQKQLSKMIQINYVKDSYDLKLLYGKAAQLNQQIIQLYEKYDIQAIVSPAFGICAPKHGSSLFITTPVFYSSIWNIASFPAGVVPVGVVQEQEQNYDNADLTSIENQKIAENMADSKGLPLSAQVVTLPFHEETCLRLMKDIEEIVQFNNNYKIQEPFIMGQSQYHKVQ
ncbi:Amidase signature domain [Pseudocohnilembus persalinus]|uniref:Amidase signature domain n=1 Tax=Pseudocohnilembus persalinus TaxID=266149 RepID=A0A0V0QG19_PSEPJ|nr:Amidase signature domain [Pseudocohnilembus persalinus]|eukprot:KRX01171.1 Amidase signature domain [Pseudocohnilembus persalinus]